MSKKKLNVSSVTVAQLSSDPALLATFVDTFHEINSEKNALDKECKPISNLIKTTLVGMAQAQGRTGDGFFVITPTGHKALLTERTGTDFDMEKFYQGILAIVGEGKKANEIRALREACTTKSTSLTLKVT